MDAMQGTLNWPLARAMKVHGDAEALVDGTNRWTYREWGRRINGLGAGLRALGLADGAIVSTLMGNSTRHLEYWMAVPAAGLVLNDLNFRLAVAELAFIVNDSAAQVLATDATYLGVAQQLMERCPTLKHLVYADAGGVAPVGAAVHDDLCTYEPLSSEVANRIGANTLAAICYTGGTTGLPKGVMQSHANFLANAKHIIPVMGYKVGERYIHAAPMFHAADVASTYAATWAGATHIVMGGYEPAKFCEVAVAEKMTVTLLVPTMINMLVNHPGVESFDFSQWRLLSYGASPMPAELQRRAMALLPCAFQQLYGMTEAAPLLTVCTEDDHRRGMAGEAGFVQRLKSAGAPVVGVETEVRREDGITLCEPGEPGEVFARGPNIMLGYWNRPEETAKALVGDGWYRTGDVAYADAHGYLYIVDRAKDMIISGGENVYTTEVENAVYAHPAVLEAAAFGIPHETWGEAVHVEVVVRPGATLTAEELLAHCRTLIGGYKVPRSVGIRTDPLPKSGAAKILKRELRDPFWAGKERSVN
jgi:long-chain acyl-CoA synthetase